MVYSPDTRSRSQQLRPENDRLRGLFAAVVLLGAATYGLSFGTAVDSNSATGWYVRFAVLAALMAAIGLVPKGKHFPAVTAVLAAMGFLDGLALLITAESGWALTAIVVINALQTAASVAALLLGLNAEDDNAASADYAAYVDYYNRAVRDYYSQQAQLPPEQQQSSGYASAQGQGYTDGQASAQVRRTHRPSQYADYAEFEHPAAHAGAPAHHEPEGATTQAGMPRIDHTHSSVPRPQQESGRSAWPDSPF